MNEYKILITGSMGAGKTTAIAAISDIPPISTDVQNNDLVNTKATTTVGLDYGELTLDNGDRLRIYGTPGQQRFSFMWKVLSQGALGLIILIDNSRPDPLADLADYVASFRELIDESACVVAVGRTERYAQPTLGDFSEKLAQLNVLCPILPADVRNKAEVIAIVDLLLTQLECKM